MGLIELVESRGRRSLVSGSLVAVGDFAFVVHLDFGFGPSIELGVQDVGTVSDEP